MYQRLDPPDRAKLTAAYHAMGYVEDGMKVGLGTGSTAAWLVKLIGARKHIEGLDIVAVSTSEATEALARKMGIPTSTLEEEEWLDLTIDGADEVDPDLVLIKGGGGALLREKIVATASERMVVITDPSKIVDELGAFPLPVEIVTFGWEATASLIAQVLEEHDVGGTQAVLRMDGDYPFETDEGHYILDLHLGRIGEAEALAADLLKVPGVVETGLFLDIAHTIVVGASSGEVEFHFADEEIELDPEDDGRLDRLLDHIATIDFEED